MAKPSLKANAVAVKTPMDVVAAAEAALAAVEGVRVRAMRVTASGKEGRTWVRRARRVTDRTRRRTRLRVGVEMTGRSMVTEKRMGMT